jgi:uncharacterized protein (DUF885 family)
VPPIDDISSALSALSSDVSPPRERLTKVLDLLWEFVVTVSPESATYVGDPRNADIWSDLSIDALSQREAVNAKFLEVHRTIDPDDLDDPARLDWDVIDWRLRMQAEADSFGTKYLLLTPLGGPHTQLANVISMMPTVTEKHFHDIIERMRAIPDYLEQATELLRVGKEEGVTTPRVSIEGLPAQLEAQIAEAGESVFMLPFRSGSSVVIQDTLEKLTNEAGNILESQVLPAYETFHDFVRDSYLPSAAESIARKDQPDGEEWYRHLVRVHTSTEMTPEEIHQIGLDEVARIRGQMDAVIAESGFDGTFEAFTAFLRTDPRFYFEDADELLRSYRDIAKRADPQLSKLFGTLPRLPYGVARTPGYEEKTSTTAYYRPGAPEAGRPGYFFANTYDLGSRPKWEMEALTLHEAVPGHHLQIALAQELEIHPVHKLSFFTAFTEGWALYAESLGEEMGFYADIYSKFGALSYQMWRSIRLVVDTGIHSFGWSRERAREYFIENSSKATHDVDVELDRYIAWPGQALAYKIGELKIVELRLEAIGRLGEAFDIREFHDRILGHGALPLAVLERLIADWLDSHPSLSEEG